MVFHIEMYENDFPLFGHINHIYCSSKSYYLCGQRLSSHGFNSHFQAFQVDYEDFYFSIPIKSLELNFAYIALPKKT